MLFLRSLLFYIAYAPSGALFGIIGVLLRPVPYKYRYDVIVAWNRFSIWWLKVCCGVDYKIVGQENLVSGPYVVMAKHQSPWETLLFQYYFKPICVVLKRELIRIPFFGWGLASLRPIAIDRSNPRAAIKKVREQGSKYIKQGSNILIFPEGSRIPVGQVGHYARSGADVACTCHVPVLPVAHNAGKYWSGKGFIKRPGTITVVIGHPIDTEGKNSKQVTQEVKQWVENTVQTISQ